METFDIKYSYFEIIGFALIALLIFFILRLLEKALPFILKQPDKKKAFSRYFTIAQILVWIIYFIFVIQQLSDSNHLYSFGLFIMLMLAIFWLLWNYLKEYISGGVFKMNHSFEINDTVQINEFQGKIVGLGNQSLELESENGEIIYIPYTHLSKSVIVKLHPGEMILSHSFTISVENNGKPLEKQEELKYEILSLPWASLKKSPLIKLIHEDQKHLVFELVVFTLEKEFFYKIEESVRKKYEFNDG